MSAGKLSYNRILFDFTSIKTLIEDKLPIGLGEQEVPSAILNLVLNDVISEHPTGPPGDMSMLEEAKDLICRIGCDQQLADTVIREAENLVFSELVKHIPDLGADYQYGEITHAQVSESKFVVSIPKITEFRPPHENSGPGTGLWPRTR